MLRELAANFRLLQRSLVCLVRLIVAQGLARLPLRRRQKSRPHLVILSWIFPPEISGGIYRHAPLARYASQAGYRVTVFTAPASGPPSAAGQAMLDYVGPDVEIVRMRRSGAEPSYRLYPFIDGGLHRAVDMFFRAQAYLRTSSPDVVLAAGPPFHTFIAATWLSRRLGAKLIVDYSDEWTLSPFDFVALQQLPQQRVWERRCLVAADQVFFTTQSQLELGAQTFAVPGMRDKSLLTPNGWEPLAQPVASLADVASAGQRKVVLLFAGNLGRHTNVQPFLDTLAAILRKRPQWCEVLSIRFLGQQQPSEAQRLAAFAYPQVIDIAGVVPMAQAIGEMRVADALLLFHDQRIARYVPGKLPEYLAANTPILLFNDEGESKALVRELSAGWALDSSDIEGVEHALAALIQRDTSSFDPTLRADWLRQNTRAAQVGDIMREIGALIAAR